MLKYKLGGYFALEKKKKKKKKRCSFSISSWVNLSMFDMKLNKFVNNAVLSNFVLVDRFLHINAWITRQSRWSLS